MTWKSPVIMIGLDAATWDVINPLLASGRLPNIARLMREGTWGRLRSILRYPSPALWTSITTGRLPEKHGVLDFYNDTRLHLHCLTIYDILGMSGCRVGLFRWFATWPPDPNTAFTVPPYTARSLETHPEKLGFLNDLVHPTGFRSYLKSGLQLIRHGARPPTLLKSAVELMYEAIARPEQREWGYRRRLLEAVIYTDVFAHLLREYQPGFAAIHYLLIDDLGHFYWKYREPQIFSDVTAAEARKYGEVIDAAYITADKALGIILRSMPEDALVLVLSDHGQEAIKAGTLHISVEKLIELLGFQDRVLATALIDSTFFRPRFVEDSHKTLNEFRGLIEQIELKEESGKLFRIKSQSERGIEVKIRFGSEVGLNSAVSLPDGRVIKLGDIASTRGRRSGTHSEWGILIMRGPGVRRDHEVEGASILDVAPTVLALRGQPVSRDMDGQVIEDAIEESFLNQNPMRFIESYETVERVDEEMPFTEEELEEIESKLRALGYLS